jgi:uncharacterized membrane protein YhaH (DUF805 family)
MNWYLEVLKKYAVFSGRARRSEYWYFVLFSTIASVLLMIVDSVLGTKTATGMGLLGGLYSLGVLVPSLAVSVRRLHDTNRSGWWLLIVLLPLLGLIALLVFMVLDSQPEENQYGPNPKDDPMPAAEAV